MLGATCLFTVCAACDKTQLSHTNTVDSGAQLKIIAAHFLFGRSAAAAATGIVFKILGQTHHSFGKFPNYCFLRAAAAGSPSRSSQLEASAAKWYVSCLAKMLAADPSALIIE
jgi:hypothetical protein